MCNDPELSLKEAVLAYREEYFIERGFNRLRGKTLGMTPLYLNSTIRITDLSVMRDRTWGIRSLYAFGIKITS